MQERKVHSINRLFTVFITLFFSKISHSSTQSQELRLGILHHNIKSGFKQSHEKSFDINGEYLFSSFKGDYWKIIFNPRLHLGASLNRNSGTDQYYTGLTWHIPFASYFFAELTFGGEIHDGKTKHRTKHKKALGSQFLFRESISVGFKVTKEFNLSVILDHASNAGLVRPNPGLTNIGVRLGYKF